jgi:predicted kinase
VIRSDVLRKRLFDVMPETRLPSSAYGAATTERVYLALHSQAAASLAAGYTAIVDATFLKEEERRRIAALAEIHGVPFVGLWLDAPAEVLAARIGARGRDASDADTPVLQQQLDRVAPSRCRVRHRRDPRGNPRCDRSVRQRRPFDLGVNAWNVMAAPSADATSRLTHS